MLVSLFPPSLPPSLLPSLPPPPPQCLHHRHQEQPQDPLHLLGTKIRHPRTSQVCTLPPSLPLSFPPSSFDLTLPIGPHPPSLSPPLHPLFHPFTHPSLPPSFPPSLPPSSPPSFHLLLPSFTPSLPPSFPSLPEKEGRARGAAGAEDRKRVQDQHLSDGMGGRGGGKEGGREGGREGWVGLCMLRGREGGGGGGGSDFCFWGK